MPVKSRNNEKIKTSYVSPHFILGHWIMLRGLSAIAVVVCLFASACMDLKIRVGTRPDSAVLEERLHIGVSKSKDVLEALGMAYGKGKAMFPFHDSPKELWSYYYEEGSLKDSRRIFLFVFLDQDRYDGYMWFSSLPE
jgi:hypothetical protein